MTDCLFRQNVTFSPCEYRQWRQSCVDQWSLRGRGVCHLSEGRGVHVTGVSAAYTFKLNKNILSE
jgi:hypothetical protein